MTEKDFSKRLQDKLSAFQPDESHRAEDWDLLNQQLDTVLPTAKKRRRLLWLPYALATVLVVSNGWWWLNKSNEVGKAEVEQRLGKLENRMSMVENNESQLDASLKLSSSSNANASSNLSAKPKNTEGGKNGFQISDFRLQLLESTLNSSSHAENSTIAPLNFSENNGLATEKDNQNTIKNNIHKIDNQLIETNNYTQNKPNGFQDVDLLKPVFKPLIIAENEAMPLIKTAKFNPLPKRFSFQLGVKTELVTLLSTGVTSEAGYGAGLQGGVGLGKHWRVVGGVGMVYLNYTATDKNALLGAPEELPTIVTTPNTTTQMHMSNQSCMRYDLNLRYALQPSWRLKPFVSAGMSGMFMSAYQMDLRVQNMQSMMVHQSNIEVNPQMHRQQMYRVSMGFEAALSRRVGWGLEAYYQQLFKKTTTVAPDFMGLQADIFYRF